LWKKGRKKKEKKRRKKKEEKEKKYLEAMLLKRDLQLIWPYSTHWWRRSKIKEQFSNRCIAIASGPNPRLQL